MSLTGKQLSVVEKLFGPENIPTEKTNYISTVLDAASGRTNINQIRGVTTAGSTGSGIPKQVTNVSAAMSNASAGSTSKITISFRRDPTDITFAGVTVYAKGYQGNQSPTQVGFGTDAPLTIVLNNTGESVSLIVQATGNGGSAPMSTAPSCGVQLPQNATGGFGTQTTTNITAAQVKQIAGGGSSVGSLSGSSTLFASQGNTKTLDLSTEGALDWFATVNSIGGYSTQSQPAKGGTSLSGSLRKSYLYTGLSSTVGPSGGSGLTMNSDASDSSGSALAATASFQAIQVGNHSTWLNWGFEIEAPASASALRNLNLYVTANNGTNGNSVTFGAIAKLSDDSAPEVDITQVQTDTNQSVINVYKLNFQFQSAAPGAKLRVQVFVSGFTGSMQFVNIGLQCATLF